VVCVGLGCSDIGLVMISRPGSSRRSLTRCGSTLCAPRYRLKSLLRLLIPVLAQLRVYSDRDVFSQCTGDLSNLMLFAFILGASGVIDVSFNLAMDVTVPCTAVTIPAPLILSAQSSMQTIACSTPHVLELLT